MTATDSDKHPSKIVFLYTATWIVITLRYLFGGVTLPILGKVPEMGVEAYALAAVGLIAAAIGRKALTDFAEAKVQAAEKVADATKAAAVTLAVAQKASEERNV